MNKTIEILVGIPCSGKSTYAFKEVKKNIHHARVSRDSIRETRFLFHQPFIINKINEDKVSEVFEKQLQSFLHWFYIE